MQEFSQLLVEVKVPCRILVLAVTMFACYFFYMQYLNTSQVSNCPPLTEVFNDVQFDINSLLSDSNSFDLSGGLRRKRQAGSSQTLNIGYVQQCVIDQSFDVVRQYDVYR